MKPQSIKTENEILESVLRFEELGIILGGKNEESNENNTETLTGLGSIGALCWCYSSRASISF